MPAELLNEICEKKDALSEKEVDALIIAHFRKDRCAALKSVIKQWDDSPYFQERKDIFHEAQACYSRRYFNASTMLLMAHTEGIIRDFFGDRKSDFVHVINALAKKVKKPTNQAVSLDDYIFSVALESLKIVLTKGHRHHAMHGNSTDKETEANSLRQFLYLNEVYFILEYLSLVSQEKGGTS